MQIYRIIHSEYLQILLISIFSFRKNTAKGKTMSYNVLPLPNENRKPTNDHIS